MAKQVNTLFERVPAEGFAVLLGADEHELVEALLNTAFVEACIFDIDAARVGQLRTQLDSAGLYGRVTAHQASLENLLLPPYFAHHIWASPVHTQKLIANTRLLEKDL